MLLEENVTQAKDTVLHLKLHCMILTLINYQTSKSEVIMEIFNMAVPIFLKKLELLEAHKHKVLFWGIYAPLYLRYFILMKPHTCMILTHANILQYGIQKLLSGRQRGDMGIPNKTWV